MVGVTEGGHGSEVIDAVDLQRVRRRGIGGTDISAIIGLNPWKSPHDVWLDKMGLSEYQPSEAAKWGLLLEHVIAREYAARLGVELDPTPAPDKKPIFVRHPEHDWALGSLDYRHKGGGVGVDCKMVNPRFVDKWGEDGTDEVPDEVLVQCTWYIGITGYERWDVPVLIGYRMPVYVVQPNPDLFAMLLEEGRRFWRDYVLTKTMPPVDHTRGARIMLEKAFPAERGAIRAATVDESALAVHLHDVSERIRAIKQAKDRLRNLLCEAIGADAGLQGDWGRITWKVVKGPMTVNWEAVAEMLHAGLMAAGAVAPPLSELAADFTVRAPGTRRFLPQFSLPKPEDEGGVK